MIEYEKEIKISQNSIFFFFLQARFQENNDNHL